jgi:hypothetical protein
MEHPKWMGWTDRHIPSKQLRVQLQAQVQGAKYKVRTYVVPWAYVNMAIKRLPIQRKILRCTPSLEKKKKKQCKNPSSQ